MEGPGPDSARAIGRDAVRFPVRFALPNGLPPEPGISPGEWRAIVKRELSKAARNSRGPTVGGLVPHLGFEPPADAFRRTMTLAWLSLPETRTGTAGCQPMAVSRGRDDCRAL